LSEALDRLRDFNFYAPNFLKIQTKTSGLKPFVLRDYQTKFIKFLNEINGPKRVIVLKPRQAGFSTVCAAHFFHRMATRENYLGLAMADKKGRTQTIAGIYRTYLEELDDLLKPQVDVNNSEQIHFDTKDSKGLKSGLILETANDPNAGRSGTRSFAHLSEAAFYRYAKEIDEGVQNSIPLEDSTCIIKESTANGKGGIGKSFYDLWMAAKQEESSYKAFFVAWYEVDDYKKDPDSLFRPTHEEEKILKMNPSVTYANLAWRRLKIAEYLGDEDNSLLSPAERFKQDFPTTDTEAFLSTGSPVFDPYVIQDYIDRLKAHQSRDIKDKIQIESFIIKQFKDRLKVYAPPREGKKYYVGCDVSEGLAIGDSSSICVIDDKYNQVASWHGKIDPDLLAHLLIAIGIFYKKALLVPEVNNMGHTTLTTIKNEGYSKVYRKTILDKVTKEKVIKIGWRTTAQSKADMLSEAVKITRDKAANIQDKQLLIEMNLVSRKENGTVEMNGMDRTVAFCLALMGRKDDREIKAKPKKPRHITGTGKEIEEYFKKQDKKYNNNIFD
jgi:hypothetical protein